MSERREGYWIVFDGPPGHDGPRFIEVENHDGQSQGPEQTSADWLHDGSDDDGDTWALGPFASEYHRARWQERAEAAERRIAALEAEVEDAKSLAYNFTDGRTVEESKSGLCETIDRMARRKDDHNAVLRGALDWVVENMGDEALEMEAIEVLSGKSSPLREALSSTPAGSARYVAALEAEHEAWRDVAAMLDHGASVELQEEIAWKAHVAVEDAKGEWDA